MQPQCYLNFVHYLLGIPQCVDPTNRIDLNADNKLRFYILADQNFVYKNVLTYVWTLNFVNNFLVFAFRRKVNINVAS